MGRITIAIYSIILSLIIVAPTVLNFYITQWISESNYKNSCNETAVEKIKLIDDLCTKLKWIFLGISIFFLSIGILLIVSLFFVPPMPSI
jgi:hypothetical protein